MADDNWYPGKNVVGWGKRMWKEHPSVVGAVAAAAGVAAVVGTGGVAAPILILTGAATGASLSKAIATDPGKDESKPSA